MHSAPELTAEDWVREQADLQAIQAESLGWIPLGQGAYLHAGKLPEGQEVPTIEVVGVMDAQMAGLNVLLVG